MSILIQAINFAFIVIGWCALASIAFGLLFGLLAIIWSSAWDAAVSRHFARHRLEIAKKGVHHDH